MEQSKEQMAKEYAINKRKQIISLELDRDEIAKGYFYTCDIQGAYEDGYTSCEQSMWRRADDELPQTGVLVLALDIEGGYVLAVNIDGKWKDINRVNLRFNGNWKKLLGDVAFPIVAWMPIPELPDTKTEK